MATASKESTSAEAEKLTCLPIHVLCARNRGMTCREFVEFLMQYLSGELSPAERSLFDEHLAECADCVVYLRTYQETIRLEKVAFADPGGPVPDDVPDDLVRAILAARSARPN